MWVRYQIIFYLLVNFRAKPTQSETKQLAQSVDVDDMDASLFSSLSSGQSMRRSSRRGSRSRAPPTTQTEVAREAVVLATVD